MVCAGESTQAEICSVGQVCGYTLNNLSPRGIEIVNMIPGQNHIYQCSFGSYTGGLQNVSYQLTSNPGLFLPSSPSISPIPPIILFSGGVPVPANFNYVVFQLKNIVSMTQTKIFIYCFTVI
jgi:hypothetical protein